MWRILSILAVLALVGCDERGGRTVVTVASTAPAFEHADVITLTPLAATKVREMSPGFDVTATAYLRVGVEPAESPQFRYLLDITQAADPAKDYLGHSQGIRIVVDRHSSLYLTGTTIDYRTTENGAGFWFENPNAKPTARPAASTPGPERSEGPDSPRPGASGQ
jgi:iron-sulfur cluster assembly accessory protein